MSSKVDDKVEIASLSYRITHTLNLIFILILIITGLILLALPWFAWIVYPFGVPLATLAGLNPETGAITAGVQFARLLHRMIGILWGVTIIVYASYVVLTGRVMLFDTLRKPLREQLREATALVKAYVFGSEIPMDIKRGIGRHNVLASYLTLLLIFGVLMVSLSGVAIVYLSLTPEQHRLMLLIHDIGFYIIMIFLVGHLFAVFHPKNVILLNAMFGDGKVPLEWAKDEMPAYIEKLRKA